MELQKDRFINPITGILNETCTSLVELTYQEALDRAIGIIRNCGKIGLNTASLKRRLSGTAFDGQYNSSSSLHVDQHLQTQLELQQAQRSYWDWCHKQEILIKNIKQHEHGSFYKDVCFHFLKKLIITMKCVQCLIIVCLNFNSTLAEPVKLLKKFNQVNNVHC